ncbi:hypothetical protein [Undibacterium flavidum]|uniref:Uncharacterized protein n=1 Tax=Undibacterium flavidum TaxID=2762297 RepID=A0ABR6YFT3_9BURK|nr:hypothetical protein [Undibacterium flavidum]MBC3875372.1 hypothetical protein [Undibacterium flavidum]
MKIELLGLYQNKVTGTRFEVKKYTRQISHNGRLLDGSVELKTSCGKDVNIIDNNFESLQLVLSEETIYRIC